MTRNAKQLVQEFSAEILNGDIDQLKTFDFRTLIDSEKYGCPERNFDCDDTNIMRAIYVVLWGDFLPELTMNNFGVQKQYRGDTLNTFHTMFGREMPDKPGFFAGLEKYFPSDELREKVRRYRDICSMIGNYVVLPNYSARQTTLNCYRGTNDWRDFFDRFLQELHHTLTCMPDCDPILKALIAVNDFCFRNFTGQDNFNSLIDRLFLTSYCDASGNPQKIFPLNYHWKNTADKEQYLHDAELYLEAAEKIITERGESICAALKKALA